MTVYQGQALVTREVSVPEGEGNVELRRCPAAAQTVDNSLYTEGADGLRGAQHPVPHAAPSRKTPARKCGPRKS